MTVLRVTALGACWLLLAACGGGSPTGTAGSQIPVGPPVAGESPLQTRSGTTFKARWRVSADGVRTFADGQWSWNGSCRFTVPRGDTVVCGGSTQAWWPDDPVGYADEQCTQPAMPLPRFGGGSARPVTALFSSGTCPAEAAFYEPDPDGPPLARVYQGDGRRCWPLPEEQTSKFRRARELPRRFEARLVTGPARNGWAPVMIESDDGAREFWAWKSATDGSYCYFRTASDGVMRCLPHAPSLEWWSSVTSEFYADDRCSARAAVDVVNGCERTRHALAKADGCGGRVAVHEGGPRLEHPFRLDGSRCVPASDRSLAAFSHGPEIPPRNFPEVRYAPGAGTTRMRPLYITGMPEPTPVHGKLWDSRLGVPCDAGGERCLPVSSSVGLGYFSDAQCTRALAADSGPCVVETGFGRELVPGAGYSDVHRLRGRYTGPVFRKRDGACMPFEPAAGTVFLVAERMSDDDFVAISEVQDP